MDHFLYKEDTRLLTELHDSLHELIYFHESARYINKS
jgi:hypothetical protein